MSACPGALQARPPRHHQRAGLLPARGVTPHRRGVLIPSHRPRHMGRSERPPPPHPRDPQPRVCVAAYHHAQPGGGRPAGGWFRSGTPRRSVSAPACPSRSVVGGRLARSSASTFWRRWRGGGALSPCTTRARPPCLIWGRLPSGGWHSLGSQEGLRRTLCCLASGPLL
jgi:hypothetical protein